MSQISDLHASAMNLAAQAESLRRAGDETGAQLLFRDAFATERDAALLVHPAIEPTRSILLRSAAALAVECGQYLEGEKLIATALCGDAHEEIKDELRDLYETINFHRHLELRGTSLGKGEIQLSLAGDAVGFGMIPALEYFPRIQLIESLLVRTAERQRGIPFRERGKPVKSLTDDLPLYMSTARAASFAVTIRVGKPIRQKQLFDWDTQVVTEFLECIRLFSTEQRRKLSDRVNNSAYFRNFVQQAKRLAPDGRRIRTVGFTTNVGPQVSKVALRRPPSSDWTVKPQSGHKTVQIVGMLTEASKKDTSNTIGLRDDNNKLHTIHVPKGLMSDIVRPLWDRRVTVTGQEINGVVSLREIEPVDGES